MRQLIDVYRFKCLMMQGMLKHISTLGDHLLHATEHVQQCFLYRIRSLQYYNEVMRCLETIAEECAVLRDVIILKGILKTTLNMYTKNMQNIRNMVEKLRYIYRVQGSSQFAHVLNMEFQSIKVFDWWQQFLNTCFVPLSYEIYKVTSENYIQPDVLPHIFKKNNNNRFIHAPNHESTDIIRIEKMLHENTLENRCYALKLSTHTKNIFNDSPNMSTKPLTSKHMHESQMSLIEHINGARVYSLVCNTNIVVMSGYFRNDSFQMMTNHMPLLSKKKQLHLLIKNNSVIPDAFTVGWTQQLSLRDQLVYTVNELNDHCIKCFQRLQELKGKTISTLVKDFLSCPLYVQREILTLFLLTEHDSDTQYLAYLMYDMISQESYLLKPQPLAEEIYNHLHWMIKKRFRVVIENIGQYTKQLSNFNENDINYESRILLMKVNDLVKKKAMEKLKEVQSKNGNDNNHKAQQYLDGILRIPFGIYQREHIFSFLQHFRERLRIYCEQYCSSSKESLALHAIHKNMLKNKDELTFNAINDYFTNILPKYFQNINEIDISNKIHVIEQHIKYMKISELNKFITSIKKKLSLTKLYYPNPKNPKKKAWVSTKVKLNGKFVSRSCDDIRSDLVLFFNTYLSQKTVVWSKVKSLLQLSDQNTSDHSLHQQLNEQIMYFKEEWITFKEETRCYMKNVDTILENSVFGHIKAKRSIKQVIAQWITGELKGYCFGFEGPPGTGKTSLAKNGISKCLTDNNGKKRPFAFIALGGSSNGSTLEGHSYTYVGSTWGRIVDILMETECMNPIIYIDELDKISRTEQGRELVGILTHMTDSTQNNEFMDKYFAGIRIDLSRVLFVFSYNDPDLLDPILRDRIHVVKFSPLKQADKHEVCHLHLIPEILKTIGLSMNDIIFPDDVLDYIIDNYTQEGGVRRLKEKLFEISRDLNIRHMVDPDHIMFPYTVTINFLKHDLFAECPIIHTKRILNTPRVGLVNGMYATSLGVGGITIIECFVVPKSSFLSLELTGQQGDVMKESMSVAKTVAWNLLTDDSKNTLYGRSKESSFGLHIHCPDGGTPKDGPSAGTAITISIISALLNIPVNNKVAITGEIDLNGQVCQIGGLDTKIRGAKKAGVELVLFPKTNEHDLKTIKKHYSPFHDGKLEYKMVETIWDVLPFVFPNIKYTFHQF